MTMQAALGLYAEFDMYSGCKLGSAEAAGNALNMVYSSDGRQLYVLTAVRTLGTLHSLYMVLHAKPACKCEQCPCMHAERLPDLCVGSGPLHAVTAVLEEESSAAPAQALQHAEGAPGPAWGALGLLCCIISQSCRNCSLV